MNSKEFEIKKNFYKTHLDRRPGLRGRKMGRLSTGEDLLRLARKMGVPYYSNR